MRTNVYHGIPNPFFFSHYCGQFLLNRLTNTPPSSWDRPFFQDERDFVPNRLYLDWADTERQISDERSGTQRPIGMRRIVSLVSIVLILLPLIAHGIALARATDYAPTQTYKLNIPNSRGYAAGATTETKVVNDFGSMSDGYRVYG